jgi:hypothetical protein
MASKEQQGKPAGQTTAPPPGGGQTRPRGLIGQAEVAPSGVVRKYESIPATKGTEHYKSSGGSTKR